MGNVWLDSVWFALPSSLVTKQVKFEPWMLSLTGAKVRSSCCTELLVTSICPVPDLHSILSATPESLEHVTTAGLPTVKPPVSLVAVMVTPMSWVQEDDLNRGRGPKEIFFTLPEMEIATV
jgi:hypothetical protein